MFSFDLEQILAATSLAGVVVSVHVYLWKKIVRPVLNAVNTIADIKSEVTYNGGGSIKDMVLKLSRTCDRMEVRQEIVDQRSKAALYYQDRSLFEIDKYGHMVWANECFYRNTVENGDISGELDWVTVVDEDERNDFLLELNSCLEMGRLLDIETSSTHGQKLHFIGHPYRVGKGKHEGFLIQIQILEN